MIQTAIQTSEVLLDLMAKTKLALSNQGRDSKHIPKQEQSGGG
jgi:hypothetical protein